jgi:hypothetical protein
MATLVLALRYGSQEGNQDGEGQNHFLQRLWCNETLLKA